jgi:hypothetical protein
MGNTLGARINFASRLPEGARLQNLGVGPTRQGTRRQMFGTIVEGTAGASHNRLPFARLGSHIRKPYGLFFR